MFFTGSNIDVVMNPMRDITGGTNVHIRYRKPKGQTGVWNATIQDGKIMYSATTSDIDQKGRWHLQSFVTLDGKQLKSRIVAWRIELPIPVPA